MIAVRSADEKRLSGGESSVEDEVVAVEDEILGSKKRAEARQSLTGRKCPKIPGLLYPSALDPAHGDLAQKKDFESDEKNRSLQEHI